MYKILTTLILILAPVLVDADEEPTKPKPEFTEEQLGKLKAAEEQYKDNPAVMNLIKQVKEQSGITDEPPPTPQKTEPPKPAPVQGSRTIAEVAYEKGDYEAAITQYKALAEAGDPEASLILGVMYERGQGTEPDVASAHAWYRRAAEAQPDYPDNPGMVMLGGLEKFSMSEEDLKKADQRYDEIDKEIAGETGPEGSAQQSESTTVAEDKAVSELHPASSYTSPPMIERKRVQYIDELKPRIVNITPERIVQMQHLRPEGHVSHFRPEKLSRQSNDRTINKES
ncbi:MAG: sel1 repeat family protein [Gammaproteobacteria bacterium]|nr:sel1 repeat family protein [Gammaproteobacteria bacterium]